MAATKAQLEITEVFAKYKAALLQGNGEVAWSVLDSHTTNFYVQVIRDSHSLPEGDFDRLDWIQKFTVARFRLEFRKADLVKLSGKDAFVLGVTNGWISKSTVEGMKAFDRIAVGGRYATAFLPEAPTIPAFHFIQEGTEWEFALWRSFALMNKSMEQMKKESGLSEREFIVQMLQQISKYKVDERIFSGPLD